ncbi:hypothetical protein [Mesobacillus selenatarsenatis]|uniref:Uncharacterized protein n=1 Tax=Mesobacillus selenatarsenatis (strain DSM 18680 / JCM 14380 / FERM P-15431 / SF-1) TaxID=1321606 RepID=A0A0A8WXN6_MESS1|nr:hypothetical protein [Mesobacillus selenatarsenatis]GAM12410.1 hypothetical protein SAMD00020551_0543 [Mesobacillus selenatarsenatis SF-1]
MNKENKDHSKNNEDGWNRTFFGSPTIGGFVVIGIIVAFILYNIIFN